MRNLTRILTALSLACTAPNALRAQTGDPSFRLVNRTTHVIEEVHVSPSSAHSWGPDLLGENALGSNGAFVVRLRPTTCSWDVLVVFDDGSTEESRGVDTCSLRELLVEEGQAGSGTPHQDGPGRSPAEPPKAPGDMDI